MIVRARTCDRATGRRRDIARFAASAFVLLLAGSLVAHAQPAGKVSRVSVLVFGTPSAEPNLAALVAGLRDLGYVEGRNINFRYGYAEGHPERLPDIALEAAALKPDVIVALGGDVAPFAKNATTTVPVVMLTSNDPVEAGLVASFARPGANITGVAFVASETASKRLQFLREVVPSLKRIAVFWNPDHPDGEYRDIEATARRLGIRRSIAGREKPRDRSKPPSSRPRAQIRRRSSWSRRGSSTSTATAYWSLRSGSGYRSCPAGGRGRRRAAS